LKARCPPKTLYHSPPQLDRGEKNITKGSRVEPRAGRDQSPNTVMDKKET